MVDPMGKRHLRKVMPGEPITAQDMNALVDAINALINQPHPERRQIAADGLSVRAGSAGEGTPGTPARLDNDLDAHKGVAARATEIDLVSASPWISPNTASPELTGMIDLHGGEKLKNEVGIAIEDAATALHFFTPATVWHLAKLTSDLDGRDTAATATARIYRVNPSGDEVLAGFPEVTVSAWALDGVLETGCEVFIFRHKQSRKWYAMSWECASPSPFVFATGGCYPCNDPYLGSQDEYVESFDMLTEITARESFSFSSPDWVDECCQYFSRTPGTSRANLFQQVSSFSGACAWAKANELDPITLFPLGCGIGSSSNWWVLQLILDTSGSWVFYGRVRYELYCSAIDGTIGTWVTPWTELEFDSFDCSHESDITLTLDSGGECYNNNQQSVTTSGTGTYKLTFDGQQTADISTGVNPKSALEALSNIPPNSINVTGGFVAGSQYKWLVEFYSHGFEKTQQPLMTRTITSGFPSVTIGNEVSASVYTFPTSITLSPKSA